MNFGVTQTFRHSQGRLSRVHPKLCLNSAPHKIVLFTVPEETDILLLAGLNGLRRSEFKRYQNMVRKPIPNFK
jgi:hypothetical protein